MYYVYNKHNLNLGIAFVLKELMSHCRFQFCSDTLHYWVFKENTGVLVVE